MSPSITSIEELDIEISVAYIALGGARERFHRCPNSENQGRVAEAEAEIDRLLDQRLAASGGAQACRRTSGLAHGAVGHA